jgi:hypothetical protein
MLSPLLPLWNPMRQRSRIGWRIHVLERVPRGERKINPAAETPRAAARQDLGRDQSRS